MAQVSWKRVLAVGVTLYFGGLVYYLDSQREPAPPPPPPLTPQERADENRRWNDAKLASQLHHRRLPFLSTRALTLH